MRAQILRCEIQSQPAPTTSSRNLCTFLSQLVIARAGRGVTDPRGGPRPAERVRCGSRRRPFLRRRAGPCRVEGGFSLRADSAGPAGPEIPGGGGGNCRDPPGGPARRDAARRGAPSAIRVAHGSVRRRRRRRWKPSGAAKIQPALTGAGTCGARVETRRRAGPGPVASSRAFASRPGPTGWARRAPSYPAASGGHQVMCVISRRT